jgi:hypothetical protein
VGVSNHFSSRRTPGSVSVASRRHAARRSSPRSGGSPARIAYGGGFNVFPDRTTRSPRPIRHAVGPARAALRRRLLNLWDDLVAQVPSAAYSYTFQGRPRRWTASSSRRRCADLIQDRIAHVNAGWPADHTGDVARGVSDHDPNVARFRSRAPLGRRWLSVVEEIPAPRPPSSW